MGIFGFGSDTYSKDYLMKLGKKWGINAEAGHLIDKGIPVQISGDGKYTYDLSVDIERLESEREKLTRSIQKHLRQVIDLDIKTCGLRMSNQDTINQVWSGAIFMESPLENMESYPDFYQLETAFRCYFVEFKTAVRPWKFYWSKPGEVGREGIFVTDQMKEDVPNGSERYFNDAVGDDQIHYNSTFTLMEMAAFDHSQSFLYRQHFAQQPHAFLGGLTKTSLESIPSEWKEVFLS